MFCYRPILKAERLLAGVKTETSRKRKAMVKGSGPRINTK